MRKLLTLFVLLGAVLLLQGVFSSLQAGESDGFKPIFNGKDLTGWNGDAKFWRVENGAIVAESTEKNPCKANTFLRWADGEVDDFQLKLEFKIEGSKTANSGIQFRSQVQPDGHVVGYQADLDLAGNYLGACYDEHGRGMLASRGILQTWNSPQNRKKEKIGDAAQLLKKVKQGGWNEYLIKAAGNEITLSINGEVFSRVIDLDEKNRDFAGVLALQLHSGPPMKVQFRNIQLKRLPLKGRKKIVFVAGKKSHGYFSHEHKAGCILLAEALNGSGLPVQTVVYSDGWPKDVTAFDNADTVVCYCDGGPRHFLNPHLEEFDHVMNKGVGLVCIHYAVETVIGAEGEHFIKWMGGYFEPNWSVNPHWTANFTTFPDHPICNGVKPFSINDEWYYHMRFAKDMKGVTPILSDLPTRDTLTRKDGPHSGNPFVREAVLVRKEKQHVAWAFDRAGGGRGFGFTGGHFHQNWQQDDFRKVVLNAICWSAKMDVPKTGVQSPTPTVDQLKKNQDEPPKKGWKFQSPIVKPKSNKQSSLNNTPVKTTDQALFSSAIVTTQTPGHAVKIDVPIKGAKSLFLVVADGMNGYSCDWADWAEPVIIGPNGKKKLTELKPFMASSQWGTVSVNKNVAGKPMQIDGEDIPFGFGTHANSVIGFHLPAGHTFEKFQARGGLDNGGTDQPGSASCSVQFFVLNEKPSKKFLAFVSQAPAQSGGSHDLGDALSQLKVADGLEVGLFAGEPMLRNPTNMEIDARGRVWVCEGVNYRKFRNKETPGNVKGDRIVILEDTDGDGKADKTKTFYQGHDVDSAHGICLLGNRVLISNKEQIFFLIDDDGDDKADRKEILFTGIGGAEHDHGIHAAVFGPDGKLYFNFGNMGGQIKDKNGKPIIDKMGNVVDSSRKPYQEGMVFRCNLDGSEFETLAWDFRNNWEVCVDSFGSLWQSDNDDDGNRGVRINFVMEYGNYGYKDEFTGAGWRVPRTGQNPEIPLRHFHQNDPGVVPNLLQTGAGSPTGILVYEGDLLPDLYRNQLIHTDAGPNVARAYIVKPKGAGYTAKAYPILEGVNDKWFRPSDVCIAPDGSLLIADWYDPGVGGHAMGDDTRGRLFRIAPPGAAYKMPKVDLSSTAGAIAALKSPNLATRYLGWTALHNTGDSSEAALMELYQSKNQRHRARALWALGKLDFDKNRKLKLIRSALQDKNSDIRITAIRLIRQLRNEISHEQVMDVINFKDPSPAVRRELLVGLREIKSIQFVAPYWATLAMQHDGKDRWYLEALGIAADGRWDDCLNEWMNQNNGNWNTPAGRDIIWRSRGLQTAKLLAQIIRDEKTTFEELPRYFRSLDFAPQVDQKLLADLAFNPPAGDARRVEFIVAEAIKRFSGSDFLKNPQYKADLEKLLDEEPESELFISTVNRFSLTERYPELLDIAAKYSDSQLGVDAIRVLIQKKDWKIINTALRGKETVKAVKLAQVLGLSSENAIVGLLGPVMESDKISIDVRRAAIKGLGRIKNGTTRVMKFVQKGDVAPSLEHVIAAVLHAAPQKNIRVFANKKYPLPPSKDAKPLPPVSVLAKRKGEMKNGRLVYNTHGTCSKCHIVNGLGKDVGPDLSEIGAKLSKQAMFESILYPSAGISHNYETYTAVTADGTTFSGLLVSKTDDEVSIKNAEGIVKTMKQDDLDDLVKQDTSLMPADIQKVMTEKELVDVVEYLTTLKKKKK